MSDIITDEKPVFWELFCKKAPVAHSTQEEPTKLSLGLVWGFKLSQINYDAQVSRSHSSSLIVSLYPQERGAYLKSFSLIGNGDLKAWDDSPFIDIYGNLYGYPKIADGRFMHSEDFEIIFLDGRITETGSWKNVRDRFSIRPTTLPSSQEAYTKSLVKNFPK